MTLLITAVSPEYSLCVSDQRTTSTYLGRSRIIEEGFNKHIYFGTEEYVGNISYTRVAHWRLKGVGYRLTVCNRGGSDGRVEARRMARFGVDRRCKIGIGTA